MPKCQWCDPATSAICSYESERQWNVERHEKDVHETPEQASYERLNSVIQEQMFTNLFPPSPWATETGIHHHVPMSSIHNLLLPQNILPYDASKPFASLQDPSNLAVIRRQARKLRKVTASQLRKKFGPLSSSNQGREAVINGQVILPFDQELPTGRNWLKEVVVGVKAVPTLNCLSVEVFSPDLVSDKLKLKAHYNAFATPFLISLDDFPISASELNRRKQALRSPLKCWRCGKVFGNDFPGMKQHLEEEFKEWKRE